MKVIDLLNKIANGEELPKKIKYEDIILEYDKYLQDYKIYQDGYLFTNLFGRENCKFLNEEVEILEEEKKIPEKLGYQDNADGTFYLNRKKYNSEPIKILSKKINDIIDYLDYLKSKGE